MTQNNEKTSLVASLQRVQIIHGEGKAILNRIHITQIFPNIRQLVGSTLYVSVSVLTETGSEMVEAHKKGIPIVTSPYNIHFKRTPKYFKPGMPFDLSVYVTNPDSTPANKLTVEVRSYDQTMKGSTQMDGIAKLTINPPSEASNLPLTVTTKDPTLTNDHQATRSMTAFPYETKGGPMLHISLSDKGLKSGERVNVMFNIKGSPPSQNQDFTYLILNKGQLVKAVRFKMQGQTIFTLNLEVTKEMVPSFRIVAYYHVGSLVVSDSVLAKVMDTCTDKLKLESSERVYSPRQPFSLKITGEPGARVGLVAVDKGVYVLNNKHRLTQTKIWDVIEKYDTGCTAGSGANSMGVFYDAGLIFQSNLAGGTEPRQVPTCPVPAKRRRRAITIQNLHNSLTGQYSGTDRQCCVDGMKDNIMGFSCQRRTEYISDGETCVQAFLHCCNEMSSKKAEAREETLLLARSEEDDDADMDQDIEDIISRSMFPESWLWYEEELKCPEGKEKCDTTELTKESVFKDSITSWVFTAISISKTNGICVAEPYEVVVQKKFFIDLKLPYSAVRNEQIEIKAILHNYNAFTIKVRVELLETATVCSAATKKRKYRTTIDELAPMTSWAVPYVIIPMELGKHTIEVKAVVYEHLQMDGVKKDLVVVTEGISEKSVIKILLNPAGGEQTEHVHNEIPRNQVPNTPANTYFIVSGEQLSLIIEKAIDGDSMGSLINQPSGCGEQNMIIMTLPLIATHYLDTTLQWEKVGLEKRKTAIDFIKSGYQQELAFRKQDGSFAVFSHDPSGAWLTAYVAKVFSMASEMISIEDEYICEAFNWLVQNSQQSDGIFKETFNGYHPEMVGDVRGKDANASLTAFVLIAMQEGRRLCNKTVASLPGSMEKATKYLEGRLNTLTNPYAVAMVSYALANEDKLNQEVLFKHSTGNTHWEVPGNRQFSLEATAYALLALVKAGEFDKAAPIVHWLNQQQFYGGGYGSTQSTIMVFQAVAEYTSQAKQNDHTLEIELKVSGRNKPDKWTFTKSNSFLSRSAQMEMNQNLTVKATGSGQATLSMMTLYYKMPSENQKNCTMFNLTVTLDKQNQVTYPKASESYWLTIDMLYLGDRPATMSILDIRLLTGFTVDETDLTKLSTGKERYIQKTENNNILSEKGSLILYLSQVSNKREDKIKFRLHKVMDVGLLQPGSVTLYEYLDMDKSCTRFYHPLKKDGELNRICHRDTCACAEEACCKKKSDDETSKERTAKVCEKGMDYVYKVTVENWDLTHYTDVYHLKVDQVIKEGSDYSVEGKTREFVAHPSCRESVGLKGEKDKTYLIMGHRDDVMQVEDGFKYMLGHATWLEYWPSEEESESDNYADAYEAITRMVRRFSGCKQ